MQRGRANVRDGAIKRATAHSPFLREALAALPDLAERFLSEGPLAAAEAATAVAGDDVESLLRKRRRGLALAVALGDLSGELALEDVTRLLSDFADEAIDRAVRQAIVERVPDAGAEGFGVVALGKLGSRELNYSSDVDLLLLFDPASLPRRERDDPGEAAVRIGRRMIELLQKRTGEGYVARVDLRLRPSPEVTPIVLPVNAAISHYESSALPWERAAFIRGRAVAGDTALANQFLSSIEPFVWRRSLDFGVIEEIREISGRIRDHYAQGSKIGPGFDLKRGRGGIREIEFFAQIEQMIHGGRDASVRAPATLDALAALARAGRIDDGDCNALAEAYRLLRTIEHRVQMVDDAQTHLLPADPAALDGVARLDGRDSGEELVAALEPKVAAAEALFASLAPDSDERLSGHPDKLADDLRRIGFDDPAIAAKRIADWRSGKARSLRSPAARTAFEAMLPALLAAIAAGPDPNAALNRLSDIVERLSSGVNLYRLLEARPSLARLLARILAHAPALAEQLARRPGLLDGLIDESSFEAPPEPAEFAAMLGEAMRPHPYDIAIDRARKIVNERRFALGVQLIDGRRGPLEVGQGYACVAEGAVQALTAAATAEFEETHGRFAEGELLILGLGRLGGGVLTHASDLDIIYLHTAPAGAVSDGAKPLGPADYFNRLSSRVTAALSVATASGPLYEVDTRLRPQGARGMLAVGLDAFADYQRKEAWTWEHMALTRARPVVGSEAVRGEAAALIDSILRLDRDPVQVTLDAAKMRSEMSLHKPPAGPLDVKLGPGGLVDLEFAVHVLQLTRRLALDPRLETAIAELAEAGAVEPSIVAAHDLLTSMLVAFRLVAPESDMPNAATGELVAGLCGHDSWAGLLEAHAAARHSVAQLWQRIRGEGE